MNFHPSILPVEKHTGYVSDHCASDYYRLEYDTCIEGFYAFNLNNSKTIRVSPVEYYFVYNNTSQVWESLPTIDNGDWNDRLGIMLWDLGDIISHDFMDQSDPQSFFYRYYMFLRSKIIPASREYKLTMIGI